MSLAIQTDAITHVLLADGWYQVLDHTFDIDSYEFLNGDPHEHAVEAVVHGGGQSGVCASGFMFKTFQDHEKVWMYGPLTAILAVRTKKPT